MQRIERWLYSSIDVYQTIGVETVLSSPKYRDLISKAHAAGFEVRLIYVVLESAALQLERIRIRVSEGGHDVPPEKAVSRRLRSFEQFSWFVEHVDQCFVFDNSTGEPALIAEKIGSALCLWEPLPSDMQDVLNRAGTFTYSFADK